MRRLVPVLTALLLLALLAPLMRHDVALWDWRRGKERLQAGDHSAALSFLSRAASRSPRSLPIAFDTGVACYRLGELQRASGLFRAASRSDDPLLKAAALYNLGNCAFRMAEKAAAADREGARRQFREAGRQYRLALAVASDAADARHNLDLVRSRLARLAESAASDARRAPSKRAEANAAQSAAPGAKPGREPRTGSEGRQGEGMEGGQDAPPRPGSDGTDGKGQGAKGGPVLTRDQALRLLSEARGRETLSALPPGRIRGEGGRSAAPEKDW